MENVKVRMLQAAEYEGTQLKAGSTAEVPESIAWRWVHDAYPIAEPADVPEPAQPAEDLGKLAKDKLIEVADKRGVDASGTKAELVARLAK